MHVTTRAILARSGHLARDLVPTDLGSLDITFLRDTELFKEAWANWPLAERREIVGLVLERAWVIKARKTGVRPSFDRFRFWWVGEERPEGLTFPTTLAEADAKPTPA
ncbi:hypothetical protein [Streptomyces sp. NBC_00354]|uniref:hypothetical protein n=1 Tax=Streptomyces sp. NBC_00354 TaxID=2975723 RepID=UPI002E261C59|nr:hypothetical protein OG296_18870 [Streptomyces sp. NBC_01001]